MKLLEKILVPIDVNIDSKEQIDTAIKIANLGNSEVIILHVLPEEGLDPAIRHVVTGNVSDALNEIQELFKKEGLKVSKQVIENGNAVNHILKIADKEAVNLILMGSGSKEKKEEFKRGSTTEKVMRQSNIPVWVVKSDKTNKLDHILCPVDFSKHSVYALNNAILLAKFFNASLTILGVYEKFSSLSVRFKDEAEKENAKRLKDIETELDTFIKDFDLQDVNYSIKIKDGLAHEQILRTIKEDNYDLLIMGTHGRSGLNRFVMGSVTEKVTRKVPCSFITTRTADILDLKYDNEVKEIEDYFKQANTLVKSGSYQEAIAKYLICLEINSMHIPSMYKLAHVFKILDNKEKAKYYSRMAKNILTRIWDDTIEQKITKHYTA
ncbi:universal stress protein [Gelatiniphilus marinus]|uniref:Universal stress protein n=1 Tax=Gelatiniphilus marinus TaxID=1759464 RepID=A0ABW5JX46_9FLAO